MTEARLVDTIDIAPEAQAQLFTDARTTYNWLDQDVSDDILAAAWDLAKMGPTAMNCQPLRLKVVRTKEDKDRLRPLMAAGNQEKIDHAPVQLILGWSPTFYERMGEFFPAVPTMAETLHNDPAMAESWAEDNAWLQAGYLIIALRAEGLAVGPMNGADMKSIAKEFFSKCGCTPFLVLNVGLAADPPVDWPRNPRLSWEEVSCTGTDKCC